MRMNSVDQGTYPKFTQYVRFRMPELIHEPIVTSSIKRHGSLSKQEFSGALKWQSGPLILITHLHNYQCGGVARCNGCFRHAMPDQIELHIGLVQNFEKDAYGKGMDKTAYKKRVFVVGTTLLHELCHWGNYHHGVNEATEQGVAFEVAAYGRNTG